MQLTIRHLSGSRAGQQQTVAGSSVTLGRNPSNQVAFDPEQDRAVSGLHAELLSRDDLWILRDLGSSNGTYINDEQISERIVRPGEVIQLGKNGPRLQLDYQSSNPAVAAGSARPGPAVAAAPEGRTVVLMLNDPPAGGAPAAAAMGPAMVAPPRKKGGMLRALLIVGLLFGLLLVAGLGAIVMMRSRSAPAKPVLTEQQKKAAADAAQLRAQIEQKKAAIAQTQANLQKAQATATDTTGTSAASIEAQDLNRQLSDSQRMIEELTRQLQEKNDQLRPVQSVPPPVQRPRGENVRSREDINAEILRRNQRFQATPQPRPTQASRVTEKRPVATPPPAVTATAVPAIALGPLSARKSLKKRVAVEALDNEIPLPGLPGGAARDVGTLISRALVSNGGFVEGSNGLASINVAVTNYKNDSRTNVNTKSVTRSAGAVAGVFGKSVPASPVNVESYTMSAEMAIVVRMYDSRSQQIAEFQPSASARDTISKVDVTSLSVGQISNTDTPAGDVARKVAADAIDGILRELAGMEWQGSIKTAQRDGIVTIDCGSACSIEVGDVFDVHDGGSAMGRVRVTRVESGQSFAETISAKGNLEKKSVRYVGRENDSPLSAASGRARQLQIRTKTKVFSGPGKSFKEVKQLREGTKVRYLYSVGLWAKASDGSSTFWVPMAQAQVVG